MNRKVNTFLIGQPRSGTTSLFNYLNQSPNIFLPNQKQLYHFESDYNDYRKKIGLPRKIINEYYNYNLDDYLVHYKNLKNEKIVAEITPSYLYSETAAENIYQYNPDAKLIAIFRNPVDYVESIHKLLYLNSIEYIPNLIDAIKVCKTRDKSHYRQSKKEKKEITNYYNRIKYAEQINRYLNLFDKKNILVLFYEDFRDNNQIVLDKICDFLSIDKILIEQKLNINTSKKTKIRFIMNLKNTKVVNFLSFSLPVKFRKYLGSLIRLLFTSKSKSNLTNSQKRFLMNQFKSEMETFSEILLKNGFIHHKDDLLKKWELDQS